MGALPVHHTATEDSAWDGPAAVAAMPNDDAVLRYCMAWQDASAASTPSKEGDDDADDQKSNYKFPHHRTKGGPANVPACRNALARLPGSSIPDGDKAGVRRHVQAHLDDANRKSGNSARLLLPAGIGNVLRRIHALDGRERKPWYRLVRNDAGGGELYVFGSIGGWFGVNSEDFASELAQVTGPLTVHINSGGGDAFEGITIANLLRQHTSTVNGVVTGLAASAASIIAMGCDSLTMSPGSQLMIHRAMTQVYGNRDDMAEVMALLEKMDTSLAGLYQSRAGGDLADWEAAMAAETWYTPQEAVEAGLADHIAEPPAKAGEDPDVGGYVPAAATGPAPIAAAAEPVHTEPAPAPVTEPATEVAPETPVAEQSSAGMPAAPPPDPTPAPPQPAIDPAAAVAQLRAALYPSIPKEARR